MFCYRSNSPFFLSCQFLFVLKWLHINFSFLRIFAINLRGPMHADFLFIITCKDNRFISWIYEHWTCYIEIALLRIETLVYILGNYLKNVKICINCRNVDFLSDICFEGYNNQSCVTSIYTVPTWISIFYSEIMIRKVDL